MKKKKISYERVKYEIDPHNRLVIEETGKKTNLPRFRQVLTGRFKIDKSNSLIYLVKAPAPQSVDIPHQVKLRGKWSLTEDHNLRFTLNKWGRQTMGDQLTLQGDIIDVSKNSLLFAFTTRTKKNAQSTYILNFRGAWQADKHNRLTFRIRRERGRYDILIFNGAWKISKKHQLIYQYDKAQLIRKRKRIRTLTFKGYWDIEGKRRISYILDRKSNSAFTFKTGLGIFKNKYIKYEISIGVSRKLAPIRRIVSLQGTWKIKKDAGLMFEIEYENKKIHAIVFSAKAKLTAKNRISFNLRKEINKDIRANMELSVKILEGDGQAFLRFLKSSDETAVLIGAGFRW
ncbi:MAG: hypothetical protein KAS99_03060 [Candidatus Omnitrophica bacterium]|nr:hypothetical protein [Candidatus Omnitrophota bacterium]